MKHDLASFMISNQGVNILHLFTGASSPPSLSLSSVADVIWEYNVLSSKACAAVLGHNAHFSSCHGAVACVAGLPLKFWTIMETSRTLSFNLIDTRLLKILNPEWDVSNSISTDWVSRGGWPVDTGRRVDRLIENDSSSVSRLYELLPCQSGSPWKRTKVSLKLGPLGAPGVNYWQRSSIVLETWIRKQSWSDRAH